MEKIIIKFSGDAKIGIFRRSQNTIDLDNYHGIAVLIDKNKLPYLEKGKVYSVANSKFCILEKCVILEGNYKIVSDSDCEQSRHYTDSIYVTHPFRMVKVEFEISLTKEVILNSHNQIEEIVQITDRYGKVIVKEEIEYEESPLPSEYQWMLEKILAGKKYLNLGIFIYLKMRI